MDEPQFMDSLDGEDTFCDVKSRHIFRECVVLDEHGHQITSRQEFHDEVEVGRILEGIVKLHDPR